MSGKKPDCIKCGWVPIHPNNIETMELLYGYSNTFFDGMGGININNILHTFRIEGVDDKRKELKKVLIYLKEAQSTSSNRGKNKNG